MSEDRKVALVTGATRGIGRAIAAELAGAGWFVVGTATSEKGAAAISEALGEQGAGVVLNVADDDSVAEGLKALSAEYGPPLVLVNNAGITRDNLMLRMKADEWQDVINTNLNSLYRVTKACLKGMTKARWGRVINISSVVGTMGNAGQANYAAAKAGVLALSSSLAKEVARAGITVNSICPGYIDTAALDDLGPEKRNTLARTIPMRRLGKPAEVAAAVHFLASPDAAYITGATLKIDGGIL